VVPYAHEAFFDVINDVESYQQFIPWITESRVLPETLVKKGASTSGRFDAEVKIGFTSLSFSYISKVSYEENKWVLSEARKSRIFDGLYSHWDLRPTGSDECEITYNIQMKFANPLYSAVTT
jgi:coenzyme Q-binding protein COQ10